MKKTMFVLMLSIVSQPAFSLTLKCAAAKDALDPVKIEITTDAFSSSNYSGSASIKIEGLHDSFMNVETTTATYIKLENNNENPVVVVPLKNEGDGQVLIVFEDDKGTKASVQHVNVDDDYTVLAEVTCK